MGGNREGLKGATNLARAVRRAQGLAHGLFHGFELIGVPARRRELDSVAGSLFELGSDYQAVCRWHWCRIPSTASTVLKAEWIILDERIVSNDGLPVLH